MISLVLILSLAQSSPLPALSGRVVEGSGGALAGASVVVACGDHRIAAVSDAGGRSRLDYVPAERCQVTMSLDGFVTAQQTADLGRAPVVLDLRLDVRPFASQIVVTPARGAEEDAIQVAQGAAVVQQADLRVRPFTIVTQALKDEAGVLAQQTTASQGSRIDEQFNTTTAVGYSVQATRAFAPRFKALVGGEVYDEYIAGARTLLELTIIGENLADRNDRFTALAWTSPRPT